MAPITPAGWIKQNAEPKRNPKVVNILVPAVSLDISGDKWGRLYVLISTSFHGSPTLCRLQVDHERGRDWAWRHRFLSLYTSNKHILFTQEACAKATELWLQITLLIQHGGKAHALHEFSRASGNSHTFCSVTQFERWYMKLVKDIQVPQCFNQSELL